MITAKRIIEAYLFLRGENQTIPSEVLEFIKESSLEKLKLIEDAKARTTENQLAELSDRFGAPITKITYIPNTNDGKS